jgi:leucyl aminopeptidase
MLVLTYKAASCDPVALVGKGVTFDSGGISIKPSKGMSSMKADMGGSAAVMGTFRAIDRLKPKAHVIGVIPLAENMPSHIAQRPGDVITAMNGKTIEVINTDAEGRLILADALCYAVSKKVSMIVDIATLTGAAAISMGNESAALLGNNDEIINGFLDRCEETGEQLWQLPLFDSFLDYIKSDIADLMNAAEGKGAGTSTAAKFLEQFVNKTPWAHIDMAPMMQSYKTQGVLVKGMSGYGVRTLTRFIESISQ